MNPSLSVLLISLPFFIAVIVVSVIVTRQEYNRAEAKDWVLVGGLQSDSVILKVRTPDDASSSSRTLTVSTSSGTNEKKSIVHTQELNGTEAIETVTLSGLVNGTQYSYHVSASSADNATDIVRKGTFRTPQPEGTRFNFRVATAGCATTGSRASVFRNILEDDPLLFLHLGDFHYEDLDTEDVDKRIAAIDMTMGSAPQADLFGSVGFTSMWDDHDWLGDESIGDGKGREAALKSYEMAFPYHGPLPASQMEAYEGEEYIPPYHAFTIGTVRFIISDLRSESTMTTMYSEEQKQWLYDEIADAANYDFVVWVTGPFWTGEAEEGGDDTWKGSPKDRSELSDFITSTIGGEDGPKNLIALAADAHMTGFDDGRNTYFGNSSLPPEEIYSFPILQSGPLDRIGSAKGGPYSDGCTTMRMQRNHQYSTLDFQFGQEGDDDEACIEIKSYSMSASAYGRFSSADSATKEETFSKKICGEIFNSIETAGTGSCDTVIADGKVMPILIASGVVAVACIVLSWFVTPGLWNKLGVTLTVIFVAGLSYGVGMVVNYPQAKLSVDIFPVAALALAQMITIFVVLFCCRDKKTKDDGWA